MGLAMSTGLVLRALAAELPGSASPTIAGPHESIASESPVLQVAGPPFPPEPPPREPRLPEQLPVVEPRVSDGAGPRLTFGRSFTPDLNPGFYGRFETEYFEVRNNSMVAVGGVLLAAGYFFLTFESAFFLALLLVILGSGAFTPNLYAAVGDQYQEGDPRRDGGFTLFYMGISLGALISSAVCGTLAVGYGWHASFAAAGAGMCAGLVIYLRGRRYLAPETPAVRGLPTSGSEKPAPGTLRTSTRVAILVGLGLLNVLFWAVYEQQGTIMISLAEEQTTRPSGAELQVPWALLLTVNPLCILLFAPLLDLIWRRQAKKGTAPSSLTKLAVSWRLVTSAFVVMVVAAKVTGAGRVSAFWPLSSTVLLTPGDLTFVPIALSLLTKIAPVRLVSTTMAVWMLLTLFGNVVSGYLGVVCAQWTSDQLFVLLTVLGIGGSAAMWACKKPLSRALGDEG